MYGTQANAEGWRALWKFENDVKMYGTQATSGAFANVDVFENDVKMYGTQAVLKSLVLHNRLRMM